VIASLEPAAALTVIEGLVLAVSELSVASVAVIVFVPAVFNVTVKSFVPATRAALAGSVAAPSLDVMATLCVEDARFQLASTAFTVTVKEEPAVRALGVPLLPVAVPASAVSPGTSSCNFEALPAFTVIEALAADAVSESPDVRAAVSVMFSAFVY